MLPTLVSMAALSLLLTLHGPALGRHLQEGPRFGLAHLTLVLGETAPGRSGRTHRHDYEELFIVHGGRGTYTVGDEVVEASPGDVVLIPAGVPHTFANHGTGVLHHTAVHATGTFVMDVLEP